MHFDRIILKSRYENVNALRYTQYLYYVHVDVEVAGDI